MNEYIDVEKLHAVLEGKLVGRQSGQTFARLVQMAQSIEFLPNGDVVYIAANVQQAKKYLVDFKTILNYLGMGDLLTHDCVDYVRFDNGCEARFMSAASSSHLMNQLRGVRLDNYFVDHFAEYLINDHLHGFLQTRLK